MKQASFHFIKGSNADIFCEEVESYIYNEPEDSQGYPIPDNLRAYYFYQGTK